MAGTGNRKFVPTDVLPNLPLATPDATTFSGSDYYEIALVQYTQKMHSSCPRRHCAVTCRSRPAALPGQRRPCSLPGTRDPRAKKSRRAREVHQLPAGRRRREALHPHRHDVHGGWGRTGRDRLLREPRDAAPARWRNSVDQRRHAAPVDHACGRYPPRRAQHEPRPRHVLRRRHRRSFCTAT